MYSSTQNANIITTEEASLHNTLLRKLKRYFVDMFSSCEGWLTVGAIMVAIVAVIFNYRCIGRTFLPMDEGWYMFLQKNNIADQIWRGHLLFSHWDVFNNILYNRLIQFIISLISWSLFAIGLTCWIRNSLTYKVNFILIFGLTFLLQVKLEQTFVCNYMMLVPAIGASAIGLTLLGLTFKKYWLFGICGLVLTLLMPMKVTSLAIVPLILTTVWFVEGRKWKAILWILSALTIGIALYIFLVESPAQIKDWLCNGLLEIKTGNNHHDHSVLVDWLRNTLFQYMHWIIMAITILYLVNVVKRISRLRNNRIVRYFVILVGIGFIAYFFRLNVGPEIPYKEYFFIFQNLVMTLVFMVIITLWNCFDKRMKAVVGCLLISPVCLCFGTDCAIYHYNSILRMTSPLLALTVLLPMMRRNWFTGAITILCVTAIMFVIAPPRPLTNYNGDRFDEQTVNMQTLGIDQDILISPKYADFIKFCQKEIPAGSDILPRTQHWGIVYLLDLKPVCNTYRTHMPLQPSTVSNAMAVLRDGRPLYVLNLDPDYYRYPGDISPIEQMVDDMRAQGYEVQSKTHPGHRLYRICRK